ncbi:MAG: PcfB family protein [Oscillospiraceae bacterium]|nr:PcfB family protein [Oscillospiraceae bacterium]
MNSSGDAAEQIVRMSLEGTEVALRLTGSAAKNIAAALYTIMQNKDKNKIRGKQRLTAMLKSGKELKVFTVSEEHLKQFAQEAKRYGVVYCALRGKEKSADGMVDVMVRAEDAAKINRIVERFKLATVDAASIRQEIVQARANKDAPVAPPAISKADRLVDEMLTAPIRKEESAGPNPRAAKTEKSPLSEPTSGKQNRSAGGAADLAAGRPSVRKELSEIKAGQQKKADPAQVREPEAAPKASKPQTTTHKQPKHKKKHKQKAR